MYDPLNPLAGLDDAVNRLRTKASPKPEKGVPWQAKVIDGDYYVPLGQVAELLAANNVLPAVRKGIEARVRARNDAKKQGL